MRHVKIILAHLDPSGISKRSYFWELKKGLEKMPANGPDKQQKTYFYDFYEMLNLFIYS